MKTAFKARAERNGKEKPVDNFCQQYKKKIISSNIDKFKTNYCMEKYSEKQLKKIYEEKSKELNVMTELKRRKMFQKYLKDMLKTY